MDNLTAGGIAADVSSGRRTAEAVAADALARVGAYDAVQPQAWIHRRSAADVLGDARRIDARVRAGELLPLAGVPFALKDNIDAAGMPTTAACPAFAYVPAESASVVRKLEAAGALLLGKTNLDQFATGLVGTRSPFGEPACVYNRDYVSGGSSSGSAVVVAAGLVSFALGTDTAGSGRVPAAFNGLVGLKPTKGRWSTTGVVPACRSLDCVTVLARSVADAALVDSVCAGFDAQDPYSRRTGSVPSVETAGLRVGVPARHQLQFFGDAEAAALFESARESLGSSEAAVTEIDIAALMAAARLLYGGPWVAERTAAVDQFLASNPGAFHPVVRTIIEGGRTVMGVDTFRGLYDLKRYERAAQMMWDSIDVLLLPTAPTIYRIREVLADPLTLNSNLGHYTNFVNLLDMAAIAIPAGYRANHTGFGVSLIGPAWSDGMLLNLARTLGPGFCQTTPPSLDLAPEPHRVRVAVVGAHLAGMPLHWQLSSRNARLVRQARTAPAYKLYAMAGTTPPKPALVHAGDDGMSIELEVYELGLGEFGSFVEEVPAPLAIGTVSLDDGSNVKGFVAEPRALVGATDISEYGGWRGYIASRR